MSYQEDVELQINYLIDSLLLISTRISKYVFCTCFHNTFSVNEKLK